MEPLAAARTPVFVTRLSVLLAIAFGCARIAVAQPLPALAGVPPVYLKQGESQDLTLTGQNLAGVTAVVVVPDPRGLTAALVQPDKPADGSKPDANAPAKVKLSAAADAPLGDRELRLVTPTGVTAPLVVTVGQYPFFPDTEPNNAPDAAQTVKLPASLGGRVEAPGDVDCYRFEAKKGQHLVFDIFAERLGSPLDPVLVIQDSNGRELPHADAYHGGDPMAVFDAPADGTYTLLVRDIQYRGGGDYAYRVDAGEVPYVESLLPMTGRRGQKVEVTAVGHNLAGGEKVTLDLTNAEPGPMPVRAKTAAGWSNEVTFVVTDVPQVAGPGGNHSPEQAAAVAVPAEVTGVLAKAGDEDFYKFTLPVKQQVTIEVRARAIGSPVDPLVTLKTAKGDVVEQTNGTPDADPRINRSLEAGEHVLSVRDLTYAGGPGHAYRIDLATGTPPPDFAVRFLPDATRVGRGGNVRVWCEVRRANGYKGDVTVSVEGLPPGVTTSGPVVLAEKTSGLFTLSAAPDAALGSVPITLKATGTVGGQDVTRTGQAELGSRVVRQAYLTVMEAAPFAVDAVALIKPEQLKDYGKQVADLYAKVNTQTPQLDAAQAEWEKKVGTPVEWTVLDPQKLTAASGVPLTKQPDGSVLAGGNPPERDTYTIVAAADLKAITAVRVEALADPSLPNNGPGRPPNGNFVLSKFAVTAAPKADPAKAQPVKFKTARATVEQTDYTVATVLDSKSGRGWAILPGLGNSQTAWFFPAEPAALPDGGSVLTITLDQQFGMLHTIGKFRLSVTDNPDAAKPDRASLPAPEAAILKTPTDKRTPEQKVQLSAYYRSVAPELAGDRGRLESLRNAVGPYAEIARLEGIVNATGSAFDAELKEWADRALAGGWSVADATDAKAANGTTLVREADGSVSAAGANPPTETYAVTVRTPLKQVTAVKIEALPDERFPAAGPGRAADGNFILTRLAATIPAKGPDGKPAAPAPIDFRSATATFEQKGWPAVGALDDRNDTGWAIAPNAGRPAAATFALKNPVTANDGAATLTLALEQQSPKPQHTLGRFRVWVTGAARPDDASRLPPSVAAVLRLPADKRSPQQKEELANHYRTIAPTLDSVRDRLEELKSQAPPLPLTFARGRKTFIPVPVVRTGAFAGDVQVTLEGFTAGRDPATRTPAPIAKSIIVTPLALKGDDPFGRLNVEILKACDVGTRMVVLKAEAKVGNDTYVAYSPAFPLTVTEK